MSTVRREGAGLGIPEINRRQQIRMSYVMLLWFYLAFFFPLEVLFLKHHSAPRITRLHYTFTFLLKTFFKVLEAAGQQGLPAASLPFAFNTTNKAPQEHNLQTLGDGGKENQLTWLRPLSGAFHAHLNVFAFAWALQYFVLFSLCEFSSFCFSDVHIQYKYHPSIYSP